MPILALETSTERLSLAIMRGDELFAREIDAGQRHSELAIAELHKLLAEAQLTPRDLSTVAFGQGPGSFVGVRIACGLAQGIALGANLGVVPIPTPLALAEQAVATHADAKNIFVAIDARMNEMYIAAYERDSHQPSGWQTVIAPTLVDARTLPAIRGDHWIAIGSAFDVPALAATLQQQYPFAAIINGALPSATDVARIAQRQCQHGIAPLAPEAAAPLYLRNNVAQTIAERAAAKQAATV